MFFSTAATVVLAAVASVSAVPSPTRRQAAPATTHTVIVGGNETLTYNPPSIQANQGDVIAFQFVSKNHTATQSTFAEPCSNMTTPTQGIDSGFMAVPANSTQFAQWSFTLNNASAPLWFYCRQTNPVSHCGKGMVFAVNPTAAKTFDAFQAAAMAQGGNGTSNSTSNSTTSGSAPAGGSATGTSGSSTSSPSASSTSGAMRAGGSAAGLLTVVGVLAGLVL